MHTQRFPWVEKLSRKLPKHWTCCKCAPLCQRPCPEAAELSLCSVSFYWPYTPTLMYIQLSPVCTYIVLHVLLVQWHMYAPVSPTTQCWHETCHEYMRNDMVGNRESKQAPTMCVRLLSHSHVRSGSDVRLSKLWRCLPFSVCLVSLGRCENGLLSAPADSLDYPALFSIFITEKMDAIKACCTGLFDICAV